jgi:hypothetical protein
MICMDRPVRVSQEPAINCGPVFPPSFGRLPQFKRDFYRPISVTLRLMATFYESIRFSPPSLRLSPKIYLLGSSHQELISHAVLSCFLFFFFFCLGWAELL